MVSCAPMPVLACLLLLPREVARRTNWDRRLSILFFFLFTAGTCLRGSRGTAVLGQFFRFNFRGRGLSFVYTNEVIEYQSPACGPVFGRDHCGGRGRYAGPALASTIRTAPRLSHAFLPAALLVLCACSLNMVNFSGYIRRYRRSVPYRAVQGWAVQPVPRVLFNELSYNDFYLTRHDADTVATLAP